MNVLFIRGVLNSAVFILQWAYWQRKWSNLYKSWVTESTKAKSICKQLASFSLNHSNVSLCFFFSIWKCTRLNCIYPLSITEMYSRVQLQQQKRGRGHVEKMMWAGPWMCPYSILFPFFLLNKLPESKRESWGEGGAWGGSLIRGAHADETYLGRPCVHGAPKLPVLKHWLAVSSVSAPGLEKAAVPFI